MLLRCPRAASTPGPGDDRVTGAITLADGPLADVLGAATSFQDTGLSTYAFDAFAPTARLSSLFGQQVVPTRISVTLGPNGRPRSP